MQEGDSVYILPNRGTAKKPQLFDGQGKNPIAVKLFLTNNTLCAVHSCHITLKEEEATSLLSELKKMARMDAVKGLKVKL